MIQPKAILLDFYGTVVEEDHAPVTLVCREIFNATSRAGSLDEITSYWWGIFGELFTDSHGSIFQLEKELGQESMRTTIQHFDAHLDSKRLTQLLSEYWDKYWGNPPMFPESMDVITRITELGIPICLVSNIDNDVLDSALRYNNLSFDVIVTSEDCRSYKPRPEMFEKALSLLNLTNREVLHVGDSLRSDVRGAKRMGIPVLWINRKERVLPDQFEKPDYISTNLAGILNISHWIKKTLN